MLDHGGIGQERAADQALLVRTVQRDRTPVNVKDEPYNAKGDGTSDDTAAFTAALATDRPVYVPTGRYKITAPLVLGSRGLLYGDGPGLSEIIVPAGGAITATGSVGSEIAISADIDSGDTTITTVSAHGLAAGDWIRLVSQRNAMNKTDAGDLWLGGDPTTDIVYFAEFLQVQTVGSTTQVTVASPVVFDGYRPDATDETDTNARDAATIVKVGWCVEQTVQGLSFDVQGNTTDNATGVVDFRYALRGSVRDCAFEFGSAVSGPAVTFHDSLRCVGTDLDVDRGSASLSGTGYNSLKHVGAQSCWYDSCRVIGGYQAIDATYHVSDDVHACSLFCAVTRCSVEATSHSAITTHQGTYGARVHDNYANGTVRGAYTRGHSVSVKGNNFDNMSNYAVTVQFAYNAVVSGNTGRLLAGGLFLGANAGDVKHVLVDGNDFRARSTGGLLGIGTQADSTPIEDVTVGRNRLQGFNKGVSLNAGASSWDVKGVSMPGCTTTVAYDSASTGRFEGNEPGVARLITAANTLVLSGSENDFYKVTGTTEVQNISTTGMEGRRATLKMANGALVSQAGNIKLNGNFNGVNSRTLTLVCDGTNWCEVSRSTGPEMEVQTSTGSVTLTPGVNAEVQVFTGNITADRSVKLSNTGALKGMRFKITRTAAATGAFNRSINNDGGTLLKALAVSTWAEFVHDGTDWTLLQSGSL